jgi:hypothetical protein
MSKEQKTDFIFLIISSIPAFFTALFFLISFIFNSVAKNILNYSSFRNEIAIFVVFSLAFGIFDIIFYINRKLVLRDRPAHYEKEKKYVHCALLLGSFILFFLFSISIVCGGMI